MSLVIISRGALAHGALTPDSDVLPREKPVGRMRVVLNMHGGLEALARGIDGLVTRNARAIREGKVPDLEVAQLPTDASARAWKDVVTAQMEGYTSPVTEAAWFAGQLRARGQKVRLGFRNGRPAVYDMRYNPPKLVRYWPEAPPIELGPKEGRTDERMVVAIDDDMARPVREINQAIARHNAIRIREKGLPPLYQSGVVYKPEGSPELWWDAEEILRNGHDDCEGLAAYRAGELMNKGYDARVWTRLVQMPSREMGGSGKPGGRLFHAVTRILAGPDGRPVLASDGTVATDDPSVRLGMKVPEWYRAFAKEARAAGREL